MLKILLNQDNQETCIHNYSFEDRKKKKMGGRKLEKHGKKKGKIVVIPLDNEIPSILPGNSKIMERVEGTTKMGRDKK
jgi:hypothetical protein